MTALVKSVRHPNNLRSGLQKALERGQIMVLGIVPLAFVGEELECLIQFDRGVSVDWVRASGLFDPMIDKLRTTTPDDGYGGLDGQGAKHLWCGFGS